MQLTGNIKLVGDIQEISPTFKKRELVITTDEQYPQTISIEFVQDKCSLLDGLNIDQKVKVSINLRGREWQNPETKEIKYFNSIQGWRIENMQPETTAEEDIPPMDNLSPFETASEKNDEDIDDLPF